MVGPRRTQGRRSSSRTGSGGGGFGSKTPLSDDGIGFMNTKAEAEKYKRQAERSFPKYEIGMEEISDEAKSYLKSKLVLKTEPKYRVYIKGKKK